MAILVLGIIIALVLFFVLGFTSDNDEVYTDAKGKTHVKKGPKVWKTGKKQFVALAVLILAVLLSSITVVPTGYTGILTTFGRVEDRTISAGAHLILPWQNVVKMDNRTQKVQISTDAFSSDIQQVDLQLSVNFCIDQETAQELYRTVGINYYDNVMYPRILENTKAVFSQYSAENLIAKRNTLSDLIAESTSSDMKEYGITIVSIAIEDIDFTDAFTTAVEAKQVALQTKLKTETQQAELVSIAQSTAERDLIAARTDAEKRTILAEAEASVKRIEAEMEYPGQIKVNVIRETRAVDFAK